MATRLELRTQVETYLDDPTNVVWTDVMLNAWLDEGLRRLAPVLLREGKVAASCTPGQTSLSAPTDSVYVLRVYGAQEFNWWRHYGSTISLSAAIGTGITSLTIEYLGMWSAMAAPDGSTCPLPEYACDTIVFYCVSRALRELARERVDFRKYSTVVNNQVTIADISRLADEWEDEFRRARLEARTRRQILFEASMGVPGPAEVK